MMTKFNFIKYKRIYKVLLLASSFVPVLLLTSCEDDAILSPQVEDECTGSYCNLALPLSDMYAEIKSKNPKVF